MAENNQKYDVLAARVSTLGTRAFTLVTETIQELLFAARFGTLPWVACLAPGVAFNFAVLTRLDVWLLKKSNLIWLYPQNGYLYWGYLFFGATSGFLAWGLGQVVLKQRMIRQLTEAFTVSGLKTPLGRLPSFIFDRPIDAMTRKLRLKRQHLSLKQFRDARHALEGALQIYIDTINENREQGSVDIVYSHFAMDDLVTLGDAIKNLRRDTFIVGKSRSQTIEANLGKTPHFLVGGQTGGGKSTFLRQMIASLYLNNKDYEFRLVDLKGGLEFQIFENVGRIKVVPDVPKAISLIQSLEESLKFRMATLKLNGCKDIEAFFKVPKEERKYPEGHFSERISRTILVIDEVADLFMASSGVRSKEVQEAKRVIWKIGAQGRAVGLHLVVATQRPDVKALDSQVKTHLVGVVCFPMVNDASSMTVLGNGRATDLPRIPGRAIWKSDLDMIEIQTPFMKPEEVTELIKPKDPVQNDEKGNANEASVENTGSATTSLSMEVEGCDDERARGEILSSV